MSVQILVGDALAELRKLPAESVNCCVTSPPYFGLRDYGVAGQMGLEPTPDEYVASMVAVLAEVRRVLRNDGTLWLNIGDSYAGSGKGVWDIPDAEKKARGVKESYRPSSDPVKSKRIERGSGRWGGGNLPASEGTKPKDLIGIPWMLAQALRDPYYTGSIARVRDRVWMAAMMDAEGCLCGSEYETNGRTKTNIYISVTNSAPEIIAECERIFPQTVKHVYEKRDPVNRQVFRWDVERMETKALFVREIYPYLVAKRKQAILAYTFLEMQKGLGSKKKGYLPAQQEQRSWLMRSLSTLNRGGDIDMPAWLIEPPSLFEQGYYLRQDIIWSKPNPMPESVGDRCTKAHEYLFLLSKSPSYHYDADAIAEETVYQPLNDGENSHRGSVFHSGKKAEHQLGRSSDRPRRSSRTKQDFSDERKRNGADGTAASFRAIRETRNKRSVWTVATKPFAEAHFATFPPDLIEPCILAGCPVGGTVLDPFGGAGTTGLVADRLQRNAVLIELNAEYAAMARRRIDEDRGALLDAMQAAE